MRSEEPRYSQSVGKEVICLLKYCQGKHGWCGTIPPNGDVNTVAKPTVDSGWGYCTDDCRGDWADTFKKVLKVEHGIEDSLGRHSREGTQGKQGKQG